MPATKPLFPPPADLHARDSAEQVLAESRDLLNHPCASYFELFPAALMVLNSRRQIVMANRACMDMLGAGALDALLGKRPGEAAGCAFAGIGPAGCGTSENCRECGALLAILGSITGHDRATRECQLLTTGPDGMTSAMDLKFTVSPWQTESGLYYVATILDIGHEKRRRVLERIFFHDILNSAGGAQSLVDMLMDEVPDVSREIVALVRSSLFALVDEIQKQRQLLALERNEYAVSLLTLQGLEVVSNIADEFRRHPKCIGKGITLDQEAENIPVLTDHTLLRRVVVNMLLNALEATGSGGEVTLGLSREDGSAVLWVGNDAGMPAAVRLQVFTRSFSTQGPARGLGTYSIKLLAENYLGATVGFSSTQGSGTRFWLKLPAAT
jgi:hypothetical protein